MKKDERQKVSRRAISEMVAELEKEGGNVTHNLDGKYKASFVNLGGIYDKIVEKFKGGATTELTKEKKKRIMNLIIDIVQRVKGFSFEETETHWNIEFSTKDDYSYYGYEFSIYKERLEG